MCIRFCVNTYFVHVTRSRAVREGRVVDDDLQVSVGTALVLERVLDLRDGALERREVVLAHGRRAVGVEDRLAVLEAHRLRAHRGDKFALVSVDAAR